MPAKPTQTIAIVGGGFSGAIVAYHLLGSLPAGAEIVVYEPDRDLGRGVAYADLPDQFLLNVPALLLGPIVEDQGAFLRWVQANRSAEMETFRQPDGVYFVPRAWFGTFMGDLVRDRAAAFSSVTLTHIRTPVLEVGAEDGQPSVRTVQGWRSFDAIVLATGTAPPRPLATSGSKTVPVLSAWDMGRQPVPAPDAHVVIVGTGLTMVDVVSDLVARGHRGRITGVSRHGMFHLRSGGHNPLFVPDEPLETTTRLLLRQMRRWAKTSEQRFGDWRPVIDYMRFNAPKFWRGLSLKERERFYRHVRHVWDVHRYQVPPQSDDLVQQLVAEGRLVKEKGRVVAVSAEGLIVVRDQVQRTIACDLVVNATGPDLSQGTHPASVRQLLRPFGLDVDFAIAHGLDIDDDGQVRGVPAPMQGRIWAVGNLARRRFGELSNVGSICRLAARLGPALAVQIAQPKKTPADQGSPAS